MKGSPNLPFTSITVGWGMMVVVVEGKKNCPRRKGGWGEVRERRDRKKYITVEEKHSMHPMNYFLPPSVWFAGNKAKWRVGFIQGAFGRRIVRKKNLKLKRFFFCGGRRGGIGGAKELGSRGMPFVYQS